MRTTILFLSIGLIAAYAQGQVTFTKDVAPILQEKCQSCHRPDTFAPMSLLTYEEARPWAKSIKQKVVVYRQDRRHPALQERCVPIRPGDRDHFQVGR